MSRLNKVYVPIVLALVLSFGVLIGNLMGRVGKMPTVNTSPVPTGKLDYILRTIDHEYVDTVDVDSLTEKMIPLLLEELDPHTSYIPAKDLQEVNEELQGNFGGVGIQFRMFDDTVMVMHVVNGGPSQRAGIQDGDRIVEVDDSVIAGIGFKTDDVMDVLRGKRGTKVKVTTYRPSLNDTLDFDITRGTIPVESVDVAYMMNENTGYIKVVRFGQHTYDEFLVAIAKLKAQGAKSLVVDLRGNTGGYLGAVIGMVNEFLDRGEMIVYTDGKAQRRQEYKADGSGSCRNMRVAVLLDEWSASASEIFAGAIQDNDRGLVVGRRSFGKGLVQTQKSFNDGSAMRLTIARYYTPSGRCIQKNYEKGAEDYAEDLWNRYQHGEMDSKDSISFENTKSFKTKNGRTVYDSGGIMPDVFIPRDTTGVTDFSRRISAKGLVVRFAFFYVDKHRAELMAIANEEGVKGLDKYLDQQHLLPDLLQMAEAHDVSPKAGELKESRDIIELQMKAFIAQNVMDSEGFYPIIKGLDNTIIKVEDLMGLSQEDYVQLMMKRNGE